MYQLKPVWYCPKCGMEMFKLADRPPGRYASRQLWACSQQAYRPHEWFVLFHHAGMYSLKERFYDPDDD